MTVNPVAAPGARSGPVERLLRLFTDVRAGEAATALLLTLNVFSLLTAYYLIKTVREPLILAGGGAEIKAYAAAGQALLLLIAVPLYGALASKLPRRRLINAVTSFFILCLPAFYVLARAGAPIGVPFFLWAGIFNLMIIAQFWSFANDVYTNEEGKRLFPIVGFGASAGAVLGSVIAGLLMPVVGLEQLLLVAGAILAGALVVTNVVDRRERRRTEANRPPLESTAALPAATREIRLESGEFRIADLEKARADRDRAGAAVTGAAGPGRAGDDADTPVGTGGAFGLVFKSRYLLLIALLMLFLNWVNTTGEYILSKTVSQAAQAAVAGDPMGAISEKEYIGRFFSGFYSVVNVAGLLLQLFVVSRIIKYLGVRVGIVVLPLIALLGYGFLAFYPVLGIVRWAKTAENATDYSLQNTVRNILFLPTTREEKYTAKQAIDTFFVRSGDVLQAGLVYVGAVLLAFTTNQFAIVNIALVGIWLVLAVLIGNEYARRSAATVAAGSSEASRG